MAFIKDPHFFEVNDFVESTREIVVTDGKFTRGHLFKVTGINEGNQRDPGKTYRIFCSETRKELTVTPSDIVRHEKGSYFDR